MNLGYMDCVKLVLKSFKDIPSIFKNIAKIPKICKDSVQTIKTPCTHFNMSQGAGERLSKSLSSYYMVTVLFLIIIFLGLGIDSFIMSTLVGTIAGETGMGAAIGGIIGVVAVISGLLGSLLGGVVGVFIMGLWVYLINKFDRWHKYVNKFLVFYMAYNIICCAFCIIPILICAVICLFIGMIFTLFLTVIMLIVLCLALFGVLDALNSAIPENNTNTYNQSINMDKTDF